MNITFRQFQPDDQKVFVNLVLDFYSESMEGAEMTPDMVVATINTLKAKPELGRIIVFESDTKIIGYAILINFWSNELGGNVISVDELYVVKELRSQKVASTFFEKLKQKEFGEAVALELGTSPRNTRAKKLYESLGFRLDENLGFLFKLK